MRASIKNEQNKKNASNSKQLKSNYSSKLINNSAKAKADRAIQKKMTVDASKAEILQKKKNKTGLPDQLKSGIENLSGHAMDDVKVHYNSSKPAALQAHAYAQGSNIHLASGQEKHLPHEAWHVAQQKQGRVKPTTTVAGMAVNDNVGLEKEADVMGGKAAQMKFSTKSTKLIANSKTNFDSILQGRFTASAITAWGENNVSRSKNAGINNVKAGFGSEEEDVIAHFHANGKVPKTQEFESFTATFNFFYKGKKEWETICHYNITGTIDNMNCKWDSKPPKDWITQAEELAIGKLTSLC